MQPKGTSLPLVSFFSRVFLHILALPRDAGKVVTVAS